MNKRIFAFRGFLICGMILIFHILFVYNIFYSYKYDEIKAITIISIIGECLIGVGIIFLIIFLWLKSGYSEKVLTFIVTLICCIVSLCLISHAFSSWPGNENREELFYGQVVSNVYNEEYNSRTIILDNIYFENEKFDHRIILYFENNDNLSIAQTEKYNIGNNVMVYAELVPKKLNGYSYNNDIAYYAYTDFSSIEYMNVGERNLIQKFQIKLHKTLVENLGSNLGELSYSMLTGDKNMLDSDIVNSFSLSGLGHLLAVSGLHIGFISMFFTWILKKCKANKYISLIIIGIVILFYCFLANFSGSVMRAAVMTMTLMIASILGKKNDSLNTLFFAVSVILTARPLLITYVGLLLSISSVFGILAFSPVINKFLKKIKVPGFLAGSISISVSASFCIMPTMIYFYHCIEPYSVLSNLIAIPIITFSFIAILLTTLLTMLMPFMAFSLKFSSFGLVVVKYLADFIAKIPGAGLILFGGLGIFMIYIFLFLFSRFTIKRKLKIPIAVICITMTILMVIIPNVTITKTEEVIYFNDGYYVDSIIKNSDNKTYFVGDFGNFNNIKSNMMTARIRKFDAIYLTEITERTALQLKKYFNFYPSVKVYFPIDENATGLKILLENGIQCNEFTSTSNFANGLHAIYSKEKFICYKYYIEDKAIAFFPKFKFNFSYKIIGDVYAIRCYTEPEYVYKDFVENRIFLLNKTNLGFFDCHEAYGSAISLNLQNGLFHEIVPKFL